VVGFGADDLAAEMAALKRAIQAWASGWVFGETRVGGSAVFMEMSQWKGQMARFNRRQSFKASYDGRRKAMATNLLYQPSWVSPS